MDQFSHFSKIWDYNCKTFFLKLNFSFLFLVRYCLETCLNCVANCVTQKFTPWGPNSTNDFFHGHFMDNLGNFSTYLSAYYQNFFFTKPEFLISALGSMGSRSMCKLCHKLKKSQKKNYMNSLGHDKINLDILKLWQLEILKRFLKDLLIFPVTRKEL